MAHNREFLRPADLAPMLGVSVGRIYQMIAERELPAVRVGGAIRIPRDAWDRWIQDRSIRALQSVRSDGECA